MGDSAQPPPPQPYESPSDRRRALRESARIMRREGKVNVSEVRSRDDSGEVVGLLLNPSVLENLDRQNQNISKRSSAVPGRDADQVPWAMSMSKGGKLVVVYANSGQGGRAGGSSIPAQDGRGMAAIHGGRQTVQVRSSPRPMGLLMAPPAGGGEKGGLVENPTHPKPAGAGSADPRQRRRAILAPDRQLEEDGNWDDADVMEEMGLPQGTAAQIGGVVDMEDDVYLEFEEEEEVAPAPREPTSWKLLARYMANFKPHTKAMFTRLIEEVWHLRRGIEYSEKGKNYYMITLFSRGDYDFVKRGGPWIFSQNALTWMNLCNHLKQL
ncbi:hypothetical protein ACQ4PT_003045 [Festuca glaucescens]